MDRFVIISLVFVYSLILLIIESSYLFPIDSVGIIGACFILLYIVFFCVL